MGKYNEPPDLLRHIRELERRVQALETSPRARTGSISEGQLGITDGSGETVVALGRLTATGTETAVEAPGAYGIEVREGGGLRVVDPDGHVVLALGTLDNGLVEDFGIGLFRDSGVPALEFFNGVLALRDDTGNVAVALDQGTGFGLAAPHLGQFAGSGDTNTATWPGTASADWTSIWGNFWELQQPFLTWSAYLYVPANVTASFRLSWGDQQLGIIENVAGGASGGYQYWTGKARVGEGVAFASDRWLKVEAQVVTPADGSATVKFQWLQLKGDQSS